MSISVRAFDRPAEEWDRFGSRWPGWTAFHRYGWKGVMERALGHECFYLGAFAGDALEGILPLVRVRSRIFGHYLVSMPFLNYGGPLGTEAGIVALAAAATDRARRDGAKLLELRALEPLPIDLPVSHRKITVVLDLPESTDALMKLFPAKLRSQVRRPQKEGVTVRFGADQVAPFYEIFSAHMRALGTPVMSRRLFEALPEAFGEDVWFGCAYLGERPIAGGAGFVWGDEFEMTWASALGEFNRISANMGLYWSFMERAIGQGIKRFNFGRCTPDSGTHRFKRQWGSYDKPLSWYQYSESGVASTPSPDSGPFSWGPKVWMKLPRSVTDFIGPRVSRFIP